MKIFIISLERATERRAFMQKQFAVINEGGGNKNFEILYFNAIDAKKVGGGGINSFKQYSKFKSILFRGKEMSDGERGCFASHYCLWQKCIELNEPIIVLEDDIEILPEFWQKLQNIIQSKYTYVRLMYLKTKFPLLPLEDNFYISFDNLAGTQGYYLTPTAAKGFLGGASSWYCAVDDYIDMFYIHNIPNVCIQPHIIREMLNIHESTIGSRSMKIVWYLKIIRECSRMYFQCKKAIYLEYYKKNLILPKNFP